MWYERSRVGRGIFRLRETAVDPWFQSNIYFVKGSDADLVVDTGMGLRPLTPELPLTPGKPLIALATHVHVDHVGALHEFSVRAGPRASASAFAAMPDLATYAHQFRQRAKPVTTQPSAGWSADSYVIAPAPLTRLLAEGDRIDLGDRSLRVLELPGHAPDCIGLLDDADGTFFSGDAIYDDSLIDDLPCSDRPAYRATMRRLLDEVDARIVFGGHGEAFDRTRMHEIARSYLDRGAR